MTPAPGPRAPLALRLGIAAGMRVAVLHAPDGVEAILGALPEGATLQHGLRRDDRVHVVVGFVTERDHLARNIGWLVGTLPPGGAFWVAWPTGASETVTDLTEDVVRAVAAPHGWIGERTCSVGDAWRALELVVGEDRHSAQTQST